MLQYEEQVCSLVENDAPHDFEIYFISNGTGPLNTQGTEQNRVTGYRLQGSDITDESQTPTGIKIILMPKHT